ncbi:hypothetical protein KFL_011370010 [Klebsormidium nitens]|uniref:PROP1-like PPR domain-containing protein n=1 Tax=Klebsormidium nitens TaxID=105231 RepID=A0A1Y1IVQ7_KLENI|nr:hypothetical protein KFL_011370010 [Klebsormidium nitens]|eukprot:GAQ92787.1 hypothetical protein KFL_011370010 [Klebsormidium nitens]
MALRIAFTTLRRVTRKLPAFLERLEGYTAGTTFDPSHSAPHCSTWQRQTPCRWFQLSAPAPYNLATHVPQPKSKSILKPSRPRKPPEFDMRAYLAEGGAKKPWYQMMVELAVAEDQGFFLHPADINRLVRRCAMEDNHEAALETYVNYQDAKFWPGRFLPSRQRTDIALRATNILLGLFYHNRKQRALDLVAELSEDVGSRHTLFDLLLLQCARNGDESEDQRGDGVRQLTVRDGLSIVDSMVSIGLRPTRIGMEALIDCCDAALDAKMAEEIVRRMEKEYGLPPTIITLVRLLRACVNAEDEDRALRVLNRLPREDVKTVDMQLFVMQTLQLQYEQAAESREAAEAPGSMPQLRMKLDELLHEVPVSSRHHVQCSNLR